MAGRGLARIFYIAAVFGREWQCEVWRGKVGQGEEFLMSSKKNRRQSGRVTPRSTLKGKKEEIINECLEPQPFWDDWVDYRDGQRSPVDKTKLRKVYRKLEDDYFEREKYNKKLKKLIKRRK